MKGNFYVRAYTTDKIPAEVTEIRVKKEPKKVEYEVGENFDKTGMKVVALYSDGTEKEISGFEILDGNNLTANKTDVTIKYKEDYFTVETKQSITVSIKGDVNGDNDVTTTDLMKVKKHIVEIEQLEDKSFKRADINKDSKITSTDLIQIKLIIVKK